MMPTAPDVRAAPDARAVPDTPDTPTAPVLGWLRARRARRAGTWRDRLYGVYLAALLLGVYLVPYLTAAASSLGGSSAPLLPHDPDTALVLTVFAHTLLAGLAGAHGALLGPVVVDPPTLHWLLDTPVSRPVVLRRRWWRALGRWTALGGVVGFALAFAVELGADHLNVPGLLLGTVAGAAHGAVCAGLAGTVQTAGHRREVRAVRPVLALLAVSAAVTCLLAVSGTPPGPLVTLLSWSGPWGWSARLVVASFPDLSVAPAAVLLLVACAAAVIVGGRWVPRVRGTVLRARVERLYRMTSAAYGLDFRLARVVAQGPAPVRSRRVSPPRSAWAAVPWRGVLGWVRRPLAPFVGAALLFAAAWTAVGGSVAPDAAGVAVTLGVLCLGYAGAGALVEAVRVETDDVTRSHAHPLRFRSLIVRLLGLPVAVGLAAAVVGAVAAAWAGAGVGAGTGGVALSDPVVFGAGLAVPGCVPALVAAAAVSACRGTFPVHLLVGVETPLGNTAPVQAAAWFLRAPLTVVVLLAPVLWKAAASTRPLPPAWTWLSTVPAPAVVAYLGAVTLVMFLWARSKADRLHRRQT
ncbi:MAG: hypothetical protein QG608_3703 [Actinomycetota bacterium]|nr:hypothetical protein [Actinomycetota bacterium]